MPYVSSHGRRCLVAGCANTEKARYSLLNSKCNLHRQLRKNCKCENNVFKFHKFPADSLKRKLWVKNVNRDDVTFANSRRSSFVICSVHFPDGQPSKEHPYPILHMQGAPPQQETVPGVFLSVQKTEEDVEKEVLYVVKSLCDIVCEDDTFEETESLVVRTPGHVSCSASVSEDSLSARRNRRVIKKTFKARTFEAEKLFNRIRFGRPENRTQLLPLLRQTIGLPKVKECYVKLDKISVNTPVKLSDLQTHPVLSREINRPSAFKISSFASYSAEARKARIFPVKQKLKLHDVYSFEDEFEDSDAEEDIDDHEGFEHPDIIGYDEVSESDQNEVSQTEDDEPDEVGLENDESLDNEVNNPVEETNEDVELDEDEELNADDELNEENEMEEEVCQEMSEPEEDVNIQDDIVIDEEDIGLGENANLEDDFHELEFEVEEEEQIESPVIKPMPMSVKHSEDQSLERSLPKASPFSVKHFSHNFDDELSDLKKTDSGSSVKVTFYKPFGNKTRKAVPVVTIPKRKNSFQVSLSNPEQKMLPGTSFKRSATERYVGSNKRFITMPLSSEITNSLTENTNVKIIQPFLRTDRGFRSINKNVDNYLISSFPSPDDPSEADGCAEHQRNKSLNPARTLATSDGNLKGSQMFSKIWTELHTYYDYTREVEVTFYNNSDVTEDDDGNSSMMYEDDETDGHEEMGHQNTVTDEKCLSETGLSVLVFKGLLGVLKECAPKHRTTPKMDMQDQVMIVLMKLKVGLINADLASKFNITAADCGKVFSQWLTVLYETLNHMVVWKSHDKNIRSMPEGFYESLPLTTCLVDFGLLSIRAPVKEVQVCENPARYVTSVKKFLYAVAPDGFVMFVSKLFDADVSENSIFLESGIQDNFAKGDLVLASREIVENSGLLSSDVTLDVLPHLKPENEGQALCQESINAVGRLKVFRILRGVITVPVSSASNVVHTCAALSNLGLIR